MQIERLVLVRPRRSKKINTQEGEVVGQEVGTIPKICVVLEYHHVNHQSTMVEVECEIVEQSVSILIELGSTHNYISPRVVEICAFKKVKHNKSWLVQLATGTDPRGSKKEIFLKSSNLSKTSTKSKGSSRQFQ